MVSLFTQKDGHFYFFPKSGGSKHQSKVEGLLNDLFIRKNDGGVVLPG